jgi:hypothetical protein
MKTTWILESGAWRLLIEPEGEREKALVAAYAGPEHGESRRLTALFRDGALIISEAPAEVAQIRAVRKEEGAL